MTQQNGDDLATRAAAALGLILIDHDLQNAGAFAQVFKAKDAKSSQIRALRIFNTRGEKATLERDLCGYRLAADLRDLAPGLVKVYTAQALYECSTWQANIVNMEWCGDDTLADRLRNSPEGLEDTEEVFELLKPIAKALDYLHARDLAHLDIKPSNILLDATQSKLGDFSSLAKFRQPHQVVTANFHTAEYQAPEVSEGRYGPASDLYSFAVVYYQARTGRTLAALDPGLSEIHSSSLPGLSLEESAVIREALRAKPDNRPKGIWRWLERLQYLDLDRRVRRPANPGGQKLLRKKRLKRAARIGMFGIPRSGKTSLIAMLYHPKCRTGHVKIVFTPDSETHSFAKDRFGDICENGSSDATGASSPMQLRFNLDVGSEEFEIDSFDYTGEFIIIRQQRGTEFNQLVDKLLEKVCTCDALLLLVDASEPSSPLVLDALDLLRRRFEEVSHGTDRLFPCIGVVFTKADMLDSLEGEPDEVRARLLHKIEAQKGTQWILERAREFPNSEVFAISAFGRDLSPGTRYSQEDLEPFDILRPFLWSVEAAVDRAETVSEFSLESAKRTINSLLDGADSKDYRSRLRKAKEIIEITKRDLAPDQVLHSDESSQRLESTLGELGGRVRQSGWQHTIRRARVAAILLILISIAAWGLGILYARWRADEVEEFAARHDAPQDSLVRLDRRNSFLQSFWGSPLFMNSDRVKRGIPADSEVAEEFEHFLVTKQRDRLKRDEDAQERMAALKLLRFRNGKFRDEYAGFLAHDEEASQYVEVLALPLDTPAEASQEIQQFLSRYHQRRTDAKLLEKQRLVQSTWDRRQYDEVLAATNGLLSYNVQPKGALTAAMEYVKADRDIKRMKSEVELVANRLNAVVGGELLARITLSEITIPFRAYVWESSGNARTSIKIKTDWSESTQSLLIKSRGVQNDELSYEKVQIGWSPVRVNVRMWYPGQDDERHAQSATWDLQFRGTETTADVELSSGDGSDGKVTLKLRLSCPGLSPELYRLPVYRD